ncbi:MAG: LPXTG cell wall anchor domain-containing protein, partial [Ligilactobacillus sp.]|nr:LPXTG cell wall anchor domain-containing protein [Ligilactobacillus sp.]
ASSAASEAVANADKANEADKLASNAASEANSAASEATSYAQAGDVEKASSAAQVASLAAVVASQAEATAKAAASEAEKNKGIADQAASEADEYNAQVNYATAEIKHAAKTAEQLLEQGELQRLATKVIEDIQKLEAIDGDTDSYVAIASSAASSAQSYAAIANEGANSIEQNVATVTSLVGDKDPKLDQLVSEALEIMQTANSLVQVANEASANAIKNYHEASQADSNADQALVDALKATDLIQSYAKAGDKANLITVQQEVEKALAMAQKANEVAKKAAKEAIANETLARKAAEEIASYEAKMVVITREVTTIKQNTESSSTTDTIKQTESTKDLESENVDVLAGSNSSDSFKVDQKQREAKKQEELPQTGEVPISSSLAGLGLLSASLLGLVGLGKKRKEDH